MSRSAILGLAGAIGILAVLGPADGAAPSRTTDGQPLRCCYTNQRYAGVCKVQPAQDETCASILAYLNNPRSQGKTYCGNTTIRGGWQQVECKPSPSSAPDRPTGGR